MPGGNVAQRRGTGLHTIQQHVHDAAAAVRSSLFTVYNEIHDNDLDYI
jgi:hypothetical protein